MYVCCVSILIYYILHYTSALANLSLSLSRSLALSSSHTLLCIAVPFVCVFGRTTGNSSEIRSNKINLLNLFMHMQTKMYFITCSCVHDCNIIRELPLHTHTLTHAYILMKDDHPNQWHCIEKYRIVHIAFSCVIQR